MTERRETGSGDDALRRVYGASIDGASGPHLSEDDWVRLASDEMPDDERAAVADHVAQCGVCAATWRAVSDVRAGASAFDPAAPVPVVSTPRFAIGRWAGLAAAAIVVLAVAATLQRRDAADDAPPASTPAAAPPPVAASTPAGLTAGVPSPRPWASLPAAPAVTLPAALTLTTRGAADAPGTFLAAFGPAIAPYRAERYAEAAVALEALTSRFADVPEVWFYLGVSRLLAERPAEAVPALERATASDAVGAQATWLRVVALERAGHVDGATAALRASCGAATIDAHRAACATLAAGR